MWLFTEYGFFSVTKGNKNPHKDEVCIRARDYAHLISLIRQYELRAKIKKTPMSDYPFRIVIEKRQAADIMYDLVCDIDYTNFKGHCDKQPHLFRAYIDLLHEVWSTMFVGYEFLRGKGSKALRGRKTRGMYQRGQVDYRA